MNQRNRYRRIDDYEVRSKMEMLSQLLQIQQHELNESRNRYADLFEHAPVGYFTLNKIGEVLSINQTGATLLGQQRAQIAGKPFCSFFPHINQQLFFDYLQETFANPRKTTIDLKVRDIQEEISYIRLESTVLSPQNICRMMMTDISQLQRTIKLNRDLLNENRRLMKELFHIQEKERKTLAYELHDELGQWLTAIRIENEFILNCTEKNSITFPSAQAIRESTQKMHRVIRSMLHKLCPLLHNAVELPDALFELKKQWYFSHSKTNLEFKLDDDLAPLDEQFSIIVFRLIQEGLNNIFNHAEASWAQVSINRERCRDSAPDFLVVKIEDNGKGYDTSQHYDGLGLVSMRERVVALDGRLVVRSAHNEGTEINIRLPITKQHNECSHFHTPD